LSQKYAINLPILTHLILLFDEGKIVPHYHPNNYSYMVSTGKRCIKVYKYFDSVTFKSRKGTSYKLWKDLITKVLDKQHLNKDLKAELILAAQSINSYKRKSK
jgi:hypothetical protein